MTAIPDFDPSAISHAHLLSEMGAAEADCHLGMFTQVHRLLTAARASSIPPTPKQFPLQRHQFDGHPPQRIAVHPRWQQVKGGIEFTDQVSAVMSCYAITDPREDAGRRVLTALAGTLTPHTLTLQNAHTAANFSDAGVTTCGPPSSNAPKVTG